MHTISYFRVATSRRPGRRWVLLSAVAGLLALSSSACFGNIIQVAASATGSSSSECSLVDAITAANENKATGACPAGDDSNNGGDIIILAAGTYKLTASNNNWYGPNGLPAITSKITIIGDPQGTVIMRDSSQGGTALRIFYVGGGQSLTGYNPPTDSSGNPVYTALPGPGDLTLKNLTLQNGLAQGGDGGKSSSGDGGGGLGAGGAIYNQGTLTLEGVTLNGNQAIGGNGGGATTSTSSSSSGSAGGGGGMSGKGDAFGNGGGFSSNGSWPQSSSQPGSFGNGGDSKTNGGVGGGGGAGHNGGFGGGGGSGSSTSGGFGGGAAMGGTAGYGGGSYLLTLDGGGAGMGGAIFNDGGSVTILNSTLSGNNAQGGSGDIETVASGSGYGGAIFNLNGSLTIRYSTLSGNTVTYYQNTINTGSSAIGGAVFSLQQSKPGSPAADASSKATLTINSSILYNSQQETLNSSGNTSATAIDCVNIGGSFSGSHNNIGATSATCTSSGSTLQPLLLPLGNNGGPTQTMQLLGTTDVNAGDTSNAPPLDQRGYLRDTAPDIGAFEVSSAQIKPPTVSGLQDTTVIAGNSASQVLFNIAGSTSAPAGLTVGVNSSDTSLLPVSNITVSSGCGTGTSQDSCALSITPPTGKTGKVTVTVTVTDAYGQMGEQSFVVTVIPPIPVASDVSASTASNQQLSGTMKATDALQVQLTYSIVTQPSHGTLKQSSSGSSAFTYTANSGYVGKDSFTFKANDGSSDSNVATVSINVTAPISLSGQLTAANQTVTAYENTAYSGTLQITGSSGQGLSIKIGTQPAHGTLKITNQNTGAFTYTPSTGYSGTDSFTYSATDTALNSTSNTATVSISVNAVTASGASAPIGNTLSFATYTGTPLSGTLSATDAAGNALKYAVTQPAHGTLTLTDATKGTFTYTPTAGYSGSDSFTFTATDTVTNLTSLAATASLTVNSIPVSGTAAPLANSASFTTYVNVPINGSLSASDAAGNSLTYALAKAPAHGTVTITAATGAFVYTPTTAYTGSDSFTFTATDANSSVSSQVATVTLTIKSMPSATATAPTADKAALATYEAIPVSGTLTAGDAAGNALSFSATNPAHGTLSVTAATGAFTYTPAGGFTGSDSFTFTAKDTVTGLTSTAATVSIVVNATPPAPSPPATGTLNLNTYENTAISGSLPATDALGTPLSYAVSTSPAHGTLAITASTGAFTYTPTTGYTGTDSFAFKATNTLDNATSSAATVSITVNAPPATAGTPIASGGSISLYENSPSSGTLIAQDDAGNSLSYAVSTQPAHGTVSVTASSGAFTYTPTTGYTGTDSFQFAATDTSTNTVSSPATITLTISAAPPAPAAPLVSDASVNLYQDQTVNIALSAVAASGDTISYAVVQPSHGALVPGATAGTYTYTPSAGFTGTDSFTFTATDTTINTVSTSATVTLTVNATPVGSVAPIANAAKLSLYADQPLTGSLSAVDAAGNSLTYAVGSKPSHGTLNVTAASGAFTYTPDAGYTGSDSFTFTATDSVTSAQSTAATVALTVSSAPLAAVAPLTSDANLTVYAGSPVSGVLAAVDAAGNSMSYAVATKPKNGTVSVTSTTGTFVYTPNAGFTGTDSFTFTATDTSNKLTSSPATVALTINPAPPAPAHHGGPGGIGLLTLALLLIITAWRVKPVNFFRYRFSSRGGILVALLSALITISCPAAADPASSPPQIPADSWYAGGQINIIKPDGKRDASTHGSKGWGVLLGRQFGDYSLEFSIAYHADNPRSNSAIANWAAYGANGLWYFDHHNTGWFSPFVDTGIGLEKQYYGDNSKKNSPYLNLGAGFDSTFGSSMPFRLRTDLQLQHAFNGYNDFILSVGIVFPFGGTRPAWQQPAMPDSSPQDAYPMAWCTAKGGHPYRSDKGWVCLPPVTNSKSPPDTD